MTANKTKSEILKYALVGLSSTAINLIILYSLTDYTKLYYLFSAAAAYLLSSIYNFSMNKTWTFREEFSHKFAIKYARFLILGLFSMVLNISLLYLFTDVFGVYYLLSQIIALTLVAILNFLVNKHWIFSN